MSKKSHRDFLKAGLPYYVSTSNIKASQTKFMLRHREEFIFTLHRKEFVQRIVKLNIPERTYPKTN